MFHSTPETQTDESYNHPEDIEHFAHHDKIEREEAIKEAEYQGISVEEAIAAHEVHDEPVTNSDAPQVTVKPAPKVQRETPPERMSPEQKYMGLNSDDREWGSGDAGYRVPRTPAEKLGYVWLTDTDFTPPDHI